MEFEITTLLSRDECENWLRENLHGGELNCPGCGRGEEESRYFRTTRRSELEVRRCRHCQNIYNLYSGTVFEGHHLNPEQAVLLLRGITKGEPSTVLSAELGMSYKTILDLRHEIQANAEAAQADEPLPDNESENDEMFQNAGEKRRTPPRPR